MFTSYLDYFEKKNPAFLNFAQIGRLHPTMDDLLVEVTGEPLNPQIFLDYLTKKYTELYRL